MTASSTPGLHVAIIGGGITGVMLALALSRRGISYTLYERAPGGFAELGAGIGISPNAERALAAIDPRAHAAYKRVASTTGDEADYFTWVDGRRCSNAVVARLLIGVDAFQGGRRADFLEAWARLLPEGRARFGMEIEGVVRRGDGKAELRFRGRSVVEEADVVIGCDGIRSRVRQLILGETNPASHAQYTNKFCFRALLPMAAARAVLGEARTASRFMYNGPGAHALTYAVADGTLLNALFVVSDARPWTAERHTAPGTRDEAVEAFRDWHPAVRGLVDLLPATLEKWAIFDMHACPAPRYNEGVVALAGDAAHASGPHLGSGAGFGIEDSLVLACVIKAADDEVREGRRSGKSRTQICCDALAAYNTARFERDQWLPGATREAVELFQWQNPDVGSDPEKFLPRISQLYHTIWDNDIDAMVKEAEAEFKKVVAEKPKADL
ncbi:hypothetical protein GGS24DRAFT_503931 [Hypoxylon argillaceum]|nr:hypothetical protein GGS24DRAFT_503931 [Hypoxylon argillaceum]